MADYKKIIPYINTENELDANVIALTRQYYYNDADELYLYNHAPDEASANRFITLLKEVCKQVDIPVMASLRVKRLEDIKKALYTGACAVVIPVQDIEAVLVKEAVERFGREKIWLEMDCSEKDADRNMLDAYADMGCGGILLKHTKTSERQKEMLAGLTVDVIIRDSLMRNDLEEILSNKAVVGVSTNYFDKKNIRKIKKNLKLSGIAVNTFESEIPFSEFKLNENGLIPVIAQDYKTGEVLMLAYMNEQAFDLTIETGQMTYYSRSRNEIWIKGLTSGHFQYVKALTIDCDNDTILAKVLQLGAACHTGERSCFYRDLVRKEYDETNPLTVFSDVYDVIADRKENPKEGSYTNYLFDKGIDKILKKCGEESAEIIIAAKNPDAEELKYEISDFLYHMMVLMVECGLGWDDVVKELSHRR